jgi:hypothetical protein
MTASWEAEDSKSRRDISTGSFERSLAFSILENVAETWSGGDKKMDKGSWESFKLEKRGRESPYVMVAAR